MPLPGRNVRITIGLLAGVILVGCQERPHLTTPQDLYHLDVVATRSAYLPGDSVFVRITNREAVPFIWHRCPGLKLERKTGSTWTELDDGTGTCNPAYFPVGGGESLVVVFVMPGTAPAGTYRVQARLSLLDTGPPLFWWPSPEFTVTGP